MPSVLNLLGTLPSRYRTPVHIERPGTMTLPKAADCFRLFAIWESLQGHLKILTEHLRLHPSS